jgi:hypothetical protein
MAASNWQAVNSQEVQKATGSTRFIHKSACGCGFPLYTFRKPGESVEGRLRTCDNHDRADRAQCAHLHYLTQTGGEAVLAIRLSKRLWKAVDSESGDKPRLWGRVVRITYKGSIPTKFGHAEKIYLVEVDQGSITEDFKGVEDHGHKSNKPRAARAIRRPAIHD